MAIGPPLGRRLGLAAAGLVLATTGCSTNGLIFRDDGSFVVDSPHKNQVVSQPVTVRWHLKPGTASPAGYAVFLDRTPPRPGGRLPGPNDRLNITVTTDTSVRISDIQPTNAVSDEDKNRHDVTIIMLDANGRRISELSGFVRFKVRA